MRIARHLSLSELARATGMSKATLSGIENGRANPTLETLATLAGALQIPLVELLEDARAGEIRIVRAARPRAARPRRVLAASWTPSRCAARSSVAELSLQAHEARERGALAGGARAHVYVIRGKLIAGPVERVTELGPGDYASFPADVPHTYEGRPQRRPRVAAGVRTGLMAPGRGRPDGETRTRTGDTTIFSRVLYQLSYLAVPARCYRLAGGRTGSRPSRSQASR